MNCQTAGAGLYERWMAKMLKWPPKPPPLAQKCFGEIAVVGHMILIAVPEILPWPVPIVLTVRVICVAPPKTGTFDRKPEFMSRRA